MPHPTVIRMPASTESGMYFTRPPKPSITASSSSAWTMPLSRVRPPLRTFTTVRIVAPAPGRPQKRPATALPMPCPISSRLLLCLVFVMLSATTLVSSVSMEPKPASVRPGMIAAVSMAPQLRPVQSISSRRKSGSGSPPGMSPITSVSERLQKSEMTVITTSATSVAGIFLVT